MNKIHNREYLHERTLRSKSTDNWELYKASKNRVTLKIRESKRDFVEEAIEQCTNRPKNMRSRKTAFTIETEFVIILTFNYKLKAVLLHLFNLWLTVLMISSIA